MTKLFQGLCVFLLSAPLLASAKDQLSVEVKATHVVTHDDRSSGAIFSKGMMGATAPTKQVESFNLDAIVNGDHVLLACDDSKGCESPELGTYAGEMKRNKWIKISFQLPVTHKEVSRWYRIAGSW